jgi:hypothetical protein
MFNRRLVWPKIAAEWLKEAGGQNRLALCLSRSARTCAERKVATMRKYLIAAVALATISPAFAGHVNGYTRSNGTYVAPYERSDADRTVTNNWSFQGNVNPYTGAVGHDEYTHSPSSPFYRGY